MKDTHIKEIRENLDHTPEQYAHEQQTQLYFEKKKADEFDKTIKLSDFLKENNAYDEFVKNFDLSYYKKCTFYPNANVNFINAFSWLSTYANDDKDWYDLSDKLNKLNYVSYYMDWLIHEKENLDRFKNNFKDYGFTADFEGEILKEIGNQYIGYCKSSNDTIIPTIWDERGNSIHNTAYNLTPYNKEWFETDAHWIMTKENNTNFNPKRKFKIAWTEEMKNSLKESGWRFATIEEIKHLKLED